jgi:CheY-like chemotaxis protein
MSAEDSSVSRGRVLGVAFKPEEQEILKNTLRAAGYELDFQDSEEKALSLLVSDRAYSAVLCDYIMPESTVWRFHEKIRAFGFDVPLVAAIPCDGDRIEKLIEIDATLPVLRKPFCAHEFHAACVACSPKKS